MCNAGSECNPSMMTFDGVDVMGERLAKEVRYGFAIQTINVLSSLIATEIVIYQFYEEPNIGL